MHRDSKIIGVNCVIAVIVAFYLADVAIRLVLVPSADDLAKRRDAMLSQVRANVAAGGESATPVITPRNLIDGDRAVPLLPLGGLPNRTTVFCDEGGGMVRYRSDEHGFNNPPGIWSLRPADVLLIGDSYVHGACVPNEAAMANYIRARFTKTVNLGMAGNGPLLNLAALSEFGPSLAPKLVAWFFTVDNDFQDLEVERTVPILDKVAMSDFRQNLVSRQTEADGILESYLTRFTTAAAATPDVYRDVVDVRQPINWRDIATLGAVRRALGISFSKPVRDYQGIANVLQVARERAAKWDGRLVLIYVPSSSSFFGFGRVDRTDRFIEDGVAEIAAGLGIPFLNGAEILRAAPDHDELYYYLGSHMTPLGNEIFGKAVADFLSRWMPPSSH